MLGWLLFGLLVGAAVITICVSFLDRKVAQDKMKENKIRKGVIKDIVKSSNVTHIKLDAIDEDGNEKKVEFEVENFDTTQIRKGVTIVA